MCIKVHLKVLQGTWQMWVQYCSTERRLAQMFRGATCLKVPLPVNRTDENQFPAFAHLLLRAVNCCWEGGFTALLSAGSKASLSPWQQC